MTAFVVWVSGTASGPAAATWAGSCIKERERGERKLFPLDTKTKIMPSHSPFPFPANAIVPLALISPLNETRCGRNRFRVVDVEENKKKKCVYFALFYVHIMHRSLVCVCCGFSIFAWQREPPQRVRTLVWPSFPVVTNVILDFTEVHHVTGHPNCCRMMADILCWLGQFDSVAAAVSRCANP